jgi:AcrR family transcriptional regulator
MQDRVAVTILDVASDLLTEGGELPSMADAAAAAGVAQVTLFWYSATRERLLQALTTATTALDETANRLAKADLDAVPAPGDDRISARASARAVLLP